MNIRQNVPPSAIGDGLESGPVVARLVEGLGRQRSAGRSGRLFGDGTASPVAVMRGPCV